jgi:ketosteroid isomerase-like protein
MNNFKVSLVRPRHPKSGRTRNLLSAVCGGAAICLALGTAQPKLWAAEPPAQPSGSTQPSGAAQAAPPAILNLLQDMDAASSRKDLKAVLKYYSPTFTHSDGLNYTTPQPAVTAFWQSTKTLQYSTKIDSWQAQGDNYTLETTTTIKGVQAAADRDMNLTATIKSKTIVVNQKIASQEILGEQTRLSFGEKPPAVQVNLPQQVNVAQTFNFDVVVTTPVGEDLLLGAAVEEPITPEQYLKRTDVALEPLAAGGLFKVGQAPPQPTREWISAVLIQEGGMTIVSQRLNVVKPNASVSPAPR